MAEARIRPATDADVEAAYAVLEACDLGPWAYLTLEDLRGWWPTYLKTWVAEEEDAVPAYAAIRRDWLEVYVRPEARGRGLGSRLLAEAEGALPGPEVGATVRADQPEGAEFLAAHGYAQAYETWLMSTDLPAEPPEPAWPDGVRVRTFRAEEAEAVKELSDLAYAEEPDHTVEPFDDWKAFMLDGVGFDPSCWFIAEAADGTLAGAALNWREGFVKDLVVHPAQRRRGLGEALLRHTFREFARRGVRRISLKTDCVNTSRAWRLYERLGMRKERTYLEFKKRL